MADIAKELRAYGARVDLWWAGRKRHEAEKRQRLAMQAKANREAREERQRAIAAGEVAMVQGWYQHPKDPPGFQRWWDGDRWTEHSQQSTTSQAAAKRKDANGLVIAGWVTFGIGLFFWPIFLATLILGIVVAARGVGGQGALLIIGSIVGPILSVIGVIALATGGGS